MSHETLFKIQHPSSMSVFLLPGVQARLREDERVRGGRHDRQKPDQRGGNPGPKKEAAREVT